MELSDARLKVSRIKYGDEIRLKGSMLYYKEFARRSQATSQLQRPTKEIKYIRTKHYSNWPSRDKWDWRTQANWSINYDPLYTAIKEGIYDPVGSFRRYEHGQYNGMRYNTKQKEIIAWDKAVDTSRPYNYHVLGEWRGARGTTMFNLESGKHLEVHTTVENNITNENTPNGEGVKHGTLYDNDISYFTVTGDNGWFTFNHNHRHYFRVWHDDYHKGHWVRLIQFNCNNSFVMVNINADFIWDASLAGDTWGEMFGISGRNNVVIININDGCKLDIRNKPGFFAVDKGLNNSMIVNYIGSGTVQFTGNNWNP